MWGHPDQEEGPLAFAEKRETRKWMEITMKYLDVRHARASTCRGPVGWLINNRPDQLNAMSSRDARRVRRSRGWSSTPIPTCG